jgi:tetratricopeptide (TPR) repeat protein
MTIDDTNDTKAEGEQTTITSGGGDVAGGDIDKRHGEVHVEHSTVYGPVVGINKGSITATYTIQQRPDPALHQLRAPVGDFIGREREIETLVAVLSKAASGGAAAAISGVRGMGGIGKTELAYVVANRLKGVFPDAQLVVELRGASSSSLTPEQALKTVILSFEREAKLSDEPSQLKGLYNSVLNGKRVLILADDARDAAQVRPLLPPAGCALLVTSRNRFGLPGMAPLDLGVLPSEEAEKLLLEICPRIGEHAPHLAQLCGYLPLALRVSAGLLANSSRRVGRYLEQLEMERLKHLSDPDIPDDPQASVEASLHLSYAALEPAAQRVLNQLSVFPTSFDFAAARTVVEVEGGAEALVDMLQRRSLLEWDATTERYSLHDLVRAFAAARLEDADAVRLRHARHYASVADRARKAYHQGGDASLAGLKLFDQERMNIDAAWSWVRSLAGDPKMDHLLLDFSDTMAHIGDLRYNKRRERIPQLQNALEAARRVQRHKAERTTLVNLGLVYANLGEVHQAIGYYEQALEVMRQHKYRREEGTALNDLGMAYADLGDKSAAINYYEQALAIRQEVSDQQGVASTLNNLGRLYADLGDEHRAMRFYEQALVIRKKREDRRGVGVILNNMAMAYSNLGDISNAIEHHEQALTAAREIGDRRGEVSALVPLGSIYVNLGDIGRAIDLEIEALMIAREINYRRAEGNALESLGIAYDKQGDFQRALDYYNQALAIARDLLNRDGEARLCWNLGEALEKQGELARAAELMQVCVDYRREILHVDVEKDAAQLEQLRQRLAISQNLPPPDAPNGG